MKEVIIPKTDLMVRNLCMGTVLCGSKLDKKESYRLLDRFVDLGGNFLDTARVYADWIPGAVPSASEKMLGQWQKERGYSHSVVIATKGGTLDPATKRAMLGKEILIRQIEESCKHLQLDTLPLYYLHRDDEDLPVAYIMDTLFSQQDRGLLKHLACSNWRADRIAQANRYAASCGRNGFVAVSNRWSLAKPVPGVGDPTIVSMDPALEALHKELNLAAVPFSSTASGYLSKLAAGKPISEGALLTYGRPENDVLAQRAKILAQEKGITVAQLVLIYFYHQPFPVIPITSFSNDSQMDEAMAAADLSLTDEEYAFLTSPIG